MISTTDIIAELESREKWQRVALASMCTASLSPVLVRFGQPATQRAFELGLDIAWNSILDGECDPCAVSARCTLDDLAEAACDDSSVPAYEAMFAIGVLACTLDGILDELGQPAIDSCANTAECVSSYDHVLVYGNQSRSIDPRNPPPPGRLESLLIQLQLRSIEAMGNAGKLEYHTVKEMQVFGNQLAAEIDGVLPTYAERRGWKH